MLLPKDIPPKTRKLRSVFSHPQGGARHLASMFGTDHGDDSGPGANWESWKQTPGPGMVRSANKMVISSYDKKHCIIMSECNLWNHDFYWYYNTLSCWCRLLPVGNVFWLPGNHLLHSPRNQDTRKEDQNLFVPKDLQLFLRMFGEEMRNSPNFRGFKKFLPTPTLSQKIGFLFFSCWFSSWSLKDGLHQHESSWLSSSWNRSRQVLRIKTFEPSFSEDGKFGGMFLVNFGRKNQQIRLH